MCECCHVRRSTANTCPSPSRVVPSITLCLFGSPLTQKQRQWRSGVLGNDMTQLLLRRIRTLCCTIYVFCVHKSPNPRVSVRACLCLPPITKTTPQTPADDSQASRIAQTTSRALRLSVSAASSAQSAATPPQQQQQQLQPKRFNLRDGAREAIKTMRERAEAKQVRISFIVVRLT